ncbi:HNH endonuclease signature motif containing protein [Adhaeribacter rhizoryzae]|uniref:HNH endonuclease n=1 Tax=Adhaeribacter rhizoryzae TaxID=2607907 RepID=A0A5M6D5Y9_9BACT|nr:HNH endonuclease signature motif containing protein [Adhaeribacter rhizoryzae]KAA5542924.1 HNH endonuclease [Adhaeribacter rhizoryzae]
MITINTFTGYGVHSDLASYLINAGANITEFRKLAKRELMEKYSLSEQQVIFIKKCVKRKPIEEDVSYKLLRNSNFTCCICKGKKSDSFILHHIKKYSETQDNSYENLAVLCPNDHDIAHREGDDITRKLTRNDIIKAKTDWEQTVKMYNEEMASSPKPRIIWNEIAGKIANYVRNSHFNVHRGAILFDVNTTAVFGNDGFEVEEGQDNRAKIEVEILTKVMSINNFSELGFGLSNDGYTWCMLIQTNKVKFLNDVVWMCYPLGGSNNPIQHKISNSNLLKYQDKLLKEQESF